MFASVDCKRILIGGYPLVTLWRMSAGYFIWGSQIETDGTTKCRTLMINMPYKTFAEHTMHVFRIQLAGDPTPKTPFWVWDGNEEMPTLKPSIACGSPSTAKRNGLTGGCDWHGYLTNGRLIGLAS